MNGTLIRVFLVALALLSATTASATDFAGSNVLLPIVGRTPGALGSNWLTDLVVTNASRTRNVDVQIVFSLPDGTDEYRAATIDPRASLIFKDVVKSTFGHDTAIGILRVATADPAALVTARARIYNTGSSTGEYGQIAQGFPVNKLAKQSFLPGLSGVDGNRANVGIANPSSTKTASVFISLFQSDGQERGGFSTEIPPRSVRLFNDIFGYFQAGPLDGATVQVTSSEPVYPYASIVRNDTGDADFVTATGVEFSSADVIVTPTCQNPAPLRLAINPTAGWIVTFKPGFDSQQTSDLLAMRYGFTLKNVYLHGGFFSEDITPQQVAGLRCESAVASVDQNGLIPVN